MPIRIYSLAKELGVENKELVDICVKAGIKGKGSALASLDDDEIARVKSFLEGGATTKKAEAPADFDRPIRQSQDDLARSAVKVLDDAPRARKKSPPPLGNKVPGITSDVVEEPVVEEPEPEVVEVDPTPAPEPVEPPKEPVVSEAPATSPVKRAPIIPDRNRGPVRVLDSRRKSKKDGDAGGGKKDKDAAKRDGPLNIRMAAMPEIKQPTPKPKKDEPKVQKPDIALPQDTIRKVRQRGSAPLQQFTENTKVKVKKKGKGAEGERVVADAEQPAKAGTRGKKGRGGTQESDMGNTRDARTRSRRRSGSGRRGDEDGSPLSYRRRNQRRRTGVNTAAPRKDVVELTLPCPVRTFSEASGVPAAQVIKALMGMGIMVNINAQIDEETAHLLADELGVTIGLKTQETLEDTLIKGIEDIEDNPDELVTRPPIVTFLGHVDHGKTSLLDALIGIEVASGEAGGITQHIRAYTVDKDGKRIAFVDTPGHEAFTEMRARGANVTDIAVLVVAADDGVMPQTEEAISHAKAAGVPIVVALNKIDLPGADPNKAMQDLATHDLLPSEWGGETEVVPTSAMTGEGLELLLETLLVTSELHEYTANPDRKAVGVCLEAEQESGRGVLAKMIVQNGSLNVGDVVVCGTAFGRVKAMYDTLRPNVKIKTAGPSTPVNLTGFDSPPAAGDRFVVLNDIADARSIAESRFDASRNDALAPITKRVSLEDFQARLESGNLVSDEDVVTLNLIIRADTQGSIEAIRKELEKLDHPEVQVKILQASVGGVTVADVTLASASEAVILAFNVVPDEAARSAADDKNVEVRRYEIIYKLTEDIKSTLEGKLKPEEQTVELGTAMVLKTFNISRTGTVAGCRVMRGTIERSCRVRVIRDSRIIGDYPIDTLKREKDDAKEVRQGMECGIKLSGFNDVKEADSLEAYKIEEVARTL